MTFDLDAGPVPGYTEPLCAAGIGRHAFSRS